MDFKQIASFVQVAELGSFTRAATVLRIAQPALSRQVRALEVELRQPLFNRNGRGVTLTAAGQRLLAHGRGILQQLERARHDLEDHRGAPVGQFALGVPPSVGRVVTGPLVDAFRAQFPQATLTMVEGLSTYVLEWLVQGRIDCAVVYNVPPAAAIELQPVLDEALVLVSRRDAVPAPRVSRRDAVPAPPVSRRDAGSAQQVSRRDAGPATQPPRAARRAGAAQASRPPLPGDSGPVTLADLARRELVIPSRPHSVRMLLETTLAGAGLKPTVGLEIESVPAILDLVLRHALHAVLPLNAVSGRADEFSARPIRVAAGKPMLATTLWIATSSQRPRGPLVDQAAALLAQLLRALWPAPGR